jgi:Cys-rich protein (TIGR01571 family)
MELCCKTYWCPCFVFGKAHHRLRDPTLTNYSSFNSACVGYCVVLHFGFAWVPQMLQRAEIRAKYNLMGSGLGDCCRAYWCSWRELLQEEKELIHLTQPQQPPPPQQGYQNVESMSYAPKQ